MQYALIYGRVSTDRQDNSLDIQDASCLKYISTKTLQTHPDLLCLDKDISGTIPFAQRDAGKRAIRILTQGWIPSDSQHPICSRHSASPIHVKHLVVAKVDRFARNTIDGLTVWHWAKSVGVTIHIVELGGDTLANNGPMGTVMLTCALSFAEFEVETIRDRITKTFSHKTSRNELTGTVPYGWDPVLPDGSPAAKIFIGKELKNNRDGTETEIEIWKWPPGTRLIDNPEEQHWLRVMHSLRIAGYSYKRIATHLNQHFAPTKTGGQWQQGNVAKVLSSKHTARLLSQPPPSTTQAA